MSSSESNNLSNPANFRFESFNVSDTDADAFAQEVGKVKGIFDVRSTVKNLGLSYTLQNGQKRFSRYYDSMLKDNRDEVQNLATQYLDWAAKRAGNTKRDQAAWEEYRKNVQDRPGREQTILQPLTPAQGQSILGATVPEPVTILGAMNTRLGR